MKATILVEQEVNIEYVKVRVPVRYEDEDIPYDFPGRDGDMWEARIHIDTATIEGWPQGRAGSMYMKVVDGGTYVLTDAGGKVLADLRGEYVPHGLIPGEYGDYINLEISEGGVITNWPKHPDVSEFFERDE